MPLARRPFPVRKAAFSSRHWVWSPFSIATTYAVLFNRTNAPLPEASSPRASHSFALYGPTVTHWPIGLPSSVAAGSRCLRFAGDDRDVDDLHPRGLSAPRMPTSTPSTTPCPTPSLTPPPRGRYVRHGRPLPATRRANQKPVPVYRNGQRPAGLVWTSIPPTVFDPDFGNALRTSLADFTTSCLRFGVL